jgi:hypothetical protein
MKQYNIEFFVAQNEHLDIHFLVVDSNAFKAQERWI